MTISIIVAIAENHAIGFENKLLYWLPNDLKRFKALTTGHTIIMGRRTFESLPKGALPNRRNIVLSRQDLEFAGAERYASLEAALAQCADDEEVFIIGGASVYQEAMPLADKLCITHISDTPTEADAFFGIDCHLLTKPLNTVPTVRYGEIGEPMQILYTGNLYIGRDRSLLRVIEAVKQLPRGRFFIDVYTNSQMDEAFLSQVDGEICRIHPPIPQAEVLEKQREADLLLFLEDIDGPDARVARLSFSTKITDYLSAGKCILAVGNPDTAPMQYFRENGSRLCLRGGGA